MPASKAFIDTNILLYLLSADADRADRAEVIVRNGGMISVQVLNEMANVARRKLAMPWREIIEVLALFDESEKNRGRIRSWNSDIRIEKK